MLSSVLTLGGGYPMIDLFNRTSFVKTTVYLTAVGFSTTLTLAVTPAQGQEDTDVLGSVLEEIVVTARKREESLKDVPVSI